MIKLSYDYIRGLVEGEGSFTFSTRPKKGPNGSILRTKVPAFALTMHERDKELIGAVRDTLGLTNCVYRYDYGNRYGRNQAAQSMLIVREGHQLKNIIIPFFYKRLRGNKGKQFIEWLEKMNNEDTSEYSKFLYRLYKSGWFDKNPKFL